MPKQLQRLFLAVALGGTALSGAIAPAPSLASDQGGCFMVDAAGNTVNLGSLCGYGAPSSAPTQGATQGTTQKPGPTAAPSSLTKGSIVTVPIRRRSGMTPVIGVTFNGSKTYDMILDTGASGTLVTRAMARELNLKPNGEMIASIADGSTVRFPTGRVDSIAVDAAQVRGVDVAIADNMPIGLLGHDFFGEYDIRIGKDVVEFIHR